MTSLSEIVDLKNLAPLGVVFVVNPPSTNQDCRVVSSPFRWVTFPINFDIQIQENGNDLSLAPLLLDLKYLEERWHIRATYRYLHSSKELSIAMIRLYVITSENQAVSATRDRFKRGKGIQWHLAKYRKIMRDLFSVLDFTWEAWNVSNITDLIRLGAQNGLLLFQCLRSYRSFSSSDIGSGPYFTTNQSTSADIYRLATRGNLAVSDESPNLEISDESLEKSLLEIYDNVDIRAVNQQHMQSLSKDNDELEDLLKTLNTNDIPGVKSTLYNYQRESVSEMLVRELAPVQHLMPNWVQVSSLDSSELYLDTQAMAFSRIPQFFQCAKGGILAENMGLGKTCICLALVCLTKNQVAKTPPQFALTSEKFRPKSLSLLCASIVNKSSTSWKHFSDFLPPSCKKLLVENPATFDIPEEYFRNRRHSARLAVDLPKRKTLFLSSTTLIVVPNNLYYQWISEIKKHCYDGHLNVLYVPYHNRSFNADYVFPNALQIIQHDIVLMGVSSFVNECEDEDSPLNQIYWKRFIVDEGHSMSSRVTRLVHLSTQLHVERRWLVSGTPTSGLTKLYMSDENSNKQEHAIKRKFSAKDDLTRLGVIVANFFKIAPWTKDPSLFAQNIVKPFLNQTYGSSESVRNFLSGMLIRHSIKNVENDIILPPLHHKAVFLKPSYHNKISINLFVSVLAANAVTSDRTDQDYMFHPSNKMSLKRLITNLQRSTFHWVGFSHADIEALLNICVTALNKKNGKNFAHSLKDRILLRKCIDTANIALNNKIWRLNSSLHEMSYFVEGLPKVYSKNFSVDYYGDHITVYPFMQLNSIQDFFFKNRFITNPDTLNTKMREFSQKFWKGYWRTQDKKIKKLVKKTNSGDPEIIDLESITLRADNQNKKDYSNVSLEAKKRKRRRSTSNTDEMSAVITSTKGMSPEFDDDIRNTKNSLLVGTLSAKLSHLAARLLDHHVTGLKSIVFYQFEDSAYYLVELLDLLGLNYMLYSTSIPVQKRNSKLVEFDNHKGSGICLVMDLKLASHGLTILGATRVYFINPVWKKAVEAQAIKRCHRIGQTKPVHVETLILESTLEEEMYKLRLHDKTPKRKKGKKEAIETDISGDMYDDHGMRKYFENHEFLDLDTEEPEYTKFSSPAIAQTEKIIPEIVDLQDTDIDPLNQAKVAAFIKEMREDNYSLRKPVGTFNNKTKERVWEVPLFTQAALEKINEAQLKPNKFIKDEDVINKVESEENQYDFKKLRNAVRSKVRKKARFA